MRDAETISRRAVLGGAALAVGVAATGRVSMSAAAEQKVSQADAKYQDQPKGQQRCEICLQFQPPNACRIVESPINPKGWCQYFAAKENAH
jgi:secreted PhoX family phosphatase